MPIDRKALVTRHNPTLHAADFASPLTVGNGNFAFTVDVTGLQTLYDAYMETTPLCTMSNWGWHAYPDGHTPDEVALTEYEFNGRPVFYAVEKQPGNEAIYDWLRQNPHRLNLARIGLLLDGQAIAHAQVTEIEQTLDLWEGVIRSRFSLDGMRVQVESACAPDEDTIAVRITADEPHRLAVAIDLPYGSPRIHASDWNAGERHTSVLEGKRILHVLDDTRYFIAASTPLEECGGHRFVVNADAFSLRFSERGEEPALPDEVFAQARDHWGRFWSSGGAIDLRGSRDPRAHELERRIVLSQYLTAIQCAGDLPPQETGLTCNSWYGKFHLEMLPSHTAWMALWNRGEMLRRVLPWYRARLGAARANAARNGYAGARWPKMVGPEAIDSPSTIATLLIWQQPHIIWLLELLYRTQPDEAFLRENWEIVQATADFMADFATLNAVTGEYELLPPLIPAQEEHNPRTTKNPTFEVEYWREAMQIALAWAQRLEMEAPLRWREVARRMASAPHAEGVYLAHENCPNTFPDFMRDHPSMLFAFGMLKGERLDPARVRNTLERVLRDWNFTTLWGWDFGQMAMTATRLGMPELAIEILLTETEKNSYVASGNNFQRSRRDLPLYLPGNGTLLLAVAMMAAGYDGCTVDLPGFPKDGMWNVQFEGINPLP